MARKIDKEKAIELRKQEKSYSQIKEIIGVSKSTLSYWLHDYPLSRERINELRGKNEARIERFRHTMKLKRESRLNEVLVKSKKELLPLSKRELFLAGVFLYWGEGNKQMADGLGISNTDPNVIKFACYWMTKILHIQKSKMKAVLHLYSDMNVKKEHIFWSKELGFSLKQFRKPYIKKTTTSSINYSGFKHGTCTIFGGGVKHKERVMMSIKAVADKYNKKI